MKQQEKAVEVEDIIKDIATPKVPPGDPPGPASVVIIHGSIYHNVTINHAPPQLDDLVSLIRSNVGQLPTRRRHRQHPTRSPARSNRRAAAQHLPRRTSPTHHSRRPSPPAHPAARSHASRPFLRLAQNTAEMGGI